MGQPTGKTRVVVREASIGGVISVDFLLLQEGCSPSDRTKEILDMVLASQEEPPPLQELLCPEELQRVLGDDDAGGFHVIDPDTQQCFYLVQPRERSHEAAFETAYRKTTEGL